MKEHFADEEAARRAVESYLEAWKTHAGLEFEPDVLDFRYLNAEIIDRDPEPGVIHARLDAYCVLGATAKLRLSRTSYPAPPSRFVVNQAVADMYHFYRGYREGRERLGLMGYMVYQAFCYDSGGIHEAAARYAVSESVLRKLSDLTSNKGGRDEGRKSPYSEPYTPAEREWIEHAAKALIRRAGQHAAGPMAQFAQITMADLPPLS
jgi:hypothetical protein